RTAEDIDSARAGDAADLRGEGVRVVTWADHSGDATTAKAEPGRAIGRNAGEREDLQFVPAAVVESAECGCVIDRDRAAAHERGRGDRHLRNVDVTERVLEGDRVRRERSWTA